MALRIIVQTKLKLCGLKDTKPCEVKYPLMNYQSYAKFHIGASRNHAQRQGSDKFYSVISPSVVLVANKEGIGSGSLVSTAGDIITNWHVVSGYASVAVIFKPTVDGAKPTRDDIKLANVVKYDEIADLALIRASEVPAGRTAVRLGDASEIAVGVDVHAIGHPTGEAWTYTTGIVSQLRQAYGWQAKDDPIKHTADIIQTPNSDQSGQFWRATD